MAREHHQIANTCSSRGEAPNCFFKLCRPWTRNGGRNSLYNLPLTKASKTPPSPPPSTPHPTTSLKATRQQRVKPPMMGQRILRFEPQVAGRLQQSQATRVLQQHATWADCFLDRLPKAAFQRSRSPTLAEHGFDAVPWCQVPPSWWGALCTAHTSATLHVFRLCELTIWEFKRFVLAARPLPENGLG